MVARFPRIFGSSSIRELDQRGPRLVRQTDNIISWPGTENPSDSTDLVQKSPRMATEVRIKRFAGTHQMDQSTLNGQLQVGNASPAGMASAIAAAMADDADMSSASNPGEPIIVEIRLVMQD